MAHRYGLLGPDFLPVHVNYLAPGDAEILGRSGSSVVHCPGSHDYFGHQEFPLRELESAGVNVCLGTDSLASARRIAGNDPSLDLWNEMRIFVEKHRVNPRRAIEMVTTGAARALGMHQDAGRIHEGLWCDAAAVTYAGPISESCIFERILFESEVREVMISGEVIQ